MKIQFRSVKGIRSRWFICPSCTIAYQSGLSFRSLPPRLSREFEKRGFCIQSAQYCDSKFVRFVVWQTGNSLSDWWIVVS